MARKTAQEDGGGVVPDPCSTPTLSVEAAAKVLGIGRRQAYEAAQRGDLPSIRIGRTVKVPTALLLDLLGLAPAGDC